MQIGCSAPTSGPLIGPTACCASRRRPRALGFDYVTVSDHVMIPTSIASRYPYSDSGEFPSGAAADRLEQLTAATFIAAATTKLRIVTSVMVVPHRPAVLTAKILATLDYLSKGRLTLGIGAGWCEEEFVAIGALPFAERGAVTDELMAVCKELWTVGRAEVRRQIRQVQGRAVPAQAGPARAIPIWVGGESGPALRRTARPMAMRGIRSAPTRNSRWIRWTGSRPASPSCARLTEKAGRNRRPRSAWRIAYPRTPRRSQRGRSTASANCLPAVLRTIAGRHQGAPGRRCHPRSTSACSDRPECHTRQHEAVHATTSWPKSADRESIMHLVLPSTCRVHIRNWIWIRVLEAERLGFHQVWTGEAYSTDAVSPVAWILARTTKIKAGTGIMQMPARTPLCGDDRAVAAGLPATGSSAASVHPARR